MKSINIAQRPEGPEFDAIVRTGLLFSGVPSPPFRLIAIIYEVVKCFPNYILSPFQESRLLSRPLVASHLPEVTSSCDFGFCEPVAGDK